MKSALTVEQIHQCLKDGKAKLRPLHSIKEKGKRHGYNKNYIRDWFKFPKLGKTKRN